MKIHHNEINFIYSSSLQKKTLTMYITVKTEHIKAKKNTMKCQKCKKKQSHKSQCTKHPPPIAYC